MTEEDRRQQTKREEVQRDALFGSQVYEQRSPAGPCSGLDDNLEEDGEHIAETALIEESLASCRVPAVDDRNPA